jgi:NADPH-dependent 2,4-dienoyl-CoA reductase/sulfur reductase-like enzyme/rhodanese-related sulfurtransferase
MEENKPLEIIVVGASAAGLRAAARVRRRSKDARVRVIDQGSTISYAACGLPYFLSGDIENPAKLRETPYGRIRDPEFFRAAKDIEVLIETRVERIDRDAGRAFCRSVKNGKESEYTFDRLVLASGADPVMLPGVPKDSRRIMTFKTLHDAVHLRQSLEKGEIGKVCIVGGGYIGCELAEAFGSLWGAEVILIEGAGSILPALLDPEMAAGVEAYLRSEDVDVRTGSPVKGISETEAGVTVETAGASYEADSCIVGVGVRPNSSLAAECGLVLGRSGGIAVDESLRTSDPRIYAAGDCVEVTHLVSGEPAFIPLGSLANRMGRVVGSNLAGGEETFGPVAGSAAVKMFDMNVSATGLTETAARQAGLDAACAWGTFMDRADYYPGAENIQLKLVFEKGSGRLLGLQGYGKGEVVKRVDVFSALLRARGGLESLLEAEFAYAPPYAPAVDPLFSLGCTARNAMLEGLEGLSPESSLESRIIVDVRLAEEVESAPFPGGEALNIPFEELRDRWEEIPKDTPLLMVCSKGLRSAESVRILREKGFGNVVYLGGGIFMKPPVI